MNVPPLPAGRSPRDAYARYLHAFFDRWSPIYDLFARPIGFVYRATVKEAGAAPGRALLDLCTGTGEIALRAARAGAAVTAVDFTPSMIERARDKSRGAAVRFLEMDVRRLGFPAASFDAVVLSLALHDMPPAARAAALREGSRVAREGLIVLDYAPPAGRLARRLVLALLGTFETAYLRDFVRRGGIEGAIRSAGLLPRRVARPLPGCFELWRAERPASG